MKSPFLVVAILLPILLLQCQANDDGISSMKAKRRLIACGWTPIKNLNDPHVVDIANFALSEHNKEENSNLALSRVVSGASQVVAGFNYKLVVEANDGGKQGSYEVIVWENAQNVRKLLSFIPLSQ